MEEINVNEELKVAQKNSAKPMLWVAMISMVMFFAGLTSAYVISSERTDWVRIEFPQAVYISTVLIVISSITLFFSQRALKRGKLKPSRLLLLLTLLLGLAFVYFQYQALLELDALGINFTGKESTVSASFLIGISLMHVLHLLGGIIVLMVVIYNHFKKKYNPSEMLGFELGSIYWHFVDILWIYLFFFFYFIR